MTSIASQLPHDAHGLDEILQILVNEPRQRHVVIGVIDTRKVTKVTETGASVPTIQFRRLEVIRKEGDVTTAERILRNALDGRAGDTLPFDIEDEISRDFSQISFDKEGKWVDNGLGERTPMTDIPPEPEPGSLEDDPLIKPAIEAVVTEQFVSASFLQRRLKIGFARAMALIAHMEELEIIGKRGDYEPSRSVLFEASKVAAAKRRADRKGKPAAKKTPVKTTRANDAEVANPPAKKAVAKKAAETPENVVQLDSKPAKKATAKKAAVKAQHPTASRFGSKDPKPVGELMPDFQGGEQQPQ